MTVNIAHQKSEVTSPDSVYLETGESAMLGSRFLATLTVLARRKRVIAIITGAAIAVGLLIAFASPNQYTAETQILPPRPTHSATSLLASQMAGIAGAQFTPGNLLRNPEDTYIGILSSDTLADLLIHQFDLIRVYHVRDIGAARRTLNKKTEILTESKSGFLSVSVTDRDPKRAAELANAYIDQLRTVLQHLAVTEAGQRRLFYEAQIKSAQKDLVAAEYAFLDVQKKEGVIQPDAQARALIGTVSSLKAELTSKQIQLQAMRSYSTERNPDLQLLENEISSVQSQLAQMDASHSSTRATDLSVGALPNASIKYLSAEHEVAYQQALFDLLVKQYDAAKLDEAREATVIQVVDHATPPLHKSAPSRPKIVLLAAFLGFLVACIWAWLGSRFEGDSLLLGQFREFRSALNFK